MSPAPKVQRRPPQAATSAVTADQGAAVRALAERARATGDRDAIALADVVVAALDHPNRKVASAFGLSRRGGVAPQREAAIRRRDAALKMLAATQDGALDITEIADRVVAQVRRYESTTWPRDRRRGKSDGANAALFAALEPGLPIPGPKWVADIVLKKHKKSEHSNRCV